MLTAALAGAAAPALAGPEQEVDALYDQLDGLVGQGRHGDAIPVARKILAIQEKALGPMHRLTATSLNDLAMLYSEIGAYAEAEALYRRALAIREQVLGAEHAITAISLSHLSVLYLRTGAYAKAAPLALRALAISEKTDGPGHPETAIQLINLAALYKATGAYARAEPLFQRALAINEKALGPAHPSTASSLVHLGEVYLKTGAYAQAEPLYRRALAIQEKVLGPGHPDTAASLANLAALHQATGEYVQAERLFQRVLAISEQTLGPEHPRTAIALNNLAALSQAAGDLARAEPLHKRALAIREKVLGPGHAQTASSLNNLAHVYKTTGAYVEAESLYQRALAILEQSLGPEHPDTATTLDNLAGLYAATGDVAKAEPLYLRAVAIREKAVGPAHPDTAVSLTNLASLYKFAGAYAKAAPLFRRALEIKEKALGPEHPEVGISLDNLSGLSFAVGAYDQAEALLERSLAISTRTLGAEHANAGLALDKLAFLRWDAGDGARALALKMRGRAVQEANIGRLVQAGTEERRRQYLATLDFDFDVSLSLADTVPGAGALGATAVLQLKGRVLDATADAQARLRRTLDDAGRALQAQLQQVVAQRSRLSLAGPDAQPPQAWAQRLAALAQDEARLSAELADRSAAFRQASLPVTLPQVQAALGPGDVLIEWARFVPIRPRSAQGRATRDRPRYAAYLIVRDQAPVGVDLGPADAIEQAVQRLRSRLQDRTGEPRSAEARALHRLVMQPLMAPLARLQANPAQLLLAPDGELNLVPMAALVDEQGAFLAERLTLSYLSSGRDLLRLQDAARPRSGVLVMANPDYNLPGTGQVNAQRAAAMDRSGSAMTFTPLDGTDREATLLQAIYRLPASQIATGAAATEARLKRVAGPAILHIATHGFFLQDPAAPGSALSATGAPRADRGVEVDDDAFRPPRREGLGENPLLRSGLALAGANARRSVGGEDGILTAAEASQLDLQGTQLVVLSACETGTGDVANGEGVYGLRRALVLAGAQSQLVSLWKVDDAATVLLMGAYYQRLRRGEGRAQALHSAQATLRADPATAHPFYWAPFIPVGDWRPMVPPAEAADLQ